MHVLRSVSSSLVLGSLFSLALSASIARAQWVPNGVPIDTTGATLPSAVPDGAGGAIVVWGDYRLDGIDDIFAQRIDGQGVIQWPDQGVAICTAPWTQMAPAMVADGSGGAIIAWADIRNGVDNDIYAQRIDAAGQVLWSTDGVAVCIDPLSQNRAAIASDGAGGAIITWTDNTDIRAQRVNAAGVVEWTTNGVAVCSAPAVQSGSAIISDGAGGAILVWHDNRTSGSLPSDIYAQRIDASGVPQWTADGVPLCTASLNQLFPVVVPDGTGGAIVTWSDERGGGDIYAQRIDASGDVRWTPDGAALCALPGTQNLPRIVADGAGGAIVTWKDQRADAGDIYAQRVDSLGVLQWSSGGVSVCTAPEEQTFPRVASDGAEGAIFAWLDQRSGATNDIYVQRVSASGAVEWTSDGIPMTGTTDDEMFPEIVADGSGAAIVVWGRFTCCASITCVQHVSADGLIVAAVGDLRPSPSSVVLASRPNPFSAATTIDLALDREAAVRVQVLDAAGRCVWRTDLGQLPRGTTGLVFDGLDDQGRFLPTGIYFVHVLAGTERAAHKLVFTR